MIESRPQRLWLVGRHHGLAEPGLERVAPANDAGRLGMGEQGTFVALRGLADLPAVK
jgi:hypothetical protein